LREIQKIQDKVYNYAWNRIENPFEEIQFNVLIFIGTNIINNLRRNNMPEILDEDDLEYKMEDEDWDSTEYSKKVLGFDPAIKLSRKDEKEIKATAKKLLEGMV